MSLVQQEPQIKTGQRSHWLSEDQLLIKTCCMDTALKWPLTSQLRSGQSYICSVHNKNKNKKFNLDSIYNQHKLHSKVQDIY